MFRYHLVLGTEVVGGHPMSMSSVIKLDLTPENESGNAVEKFLGFVKSRRHSMGLLTPLVVYFTMLITTYLLNFVLYHIS